MSAPKGHHYTGEPECPYCHKVCSEAWEINFGPGMEGETEIICGYCEREYKVTRQVDVTYSTYPLEERT